MRGEWSVDFPYLCCVSMQAGVEWYGDWMLRLGMWAELGGLDRVALSLGDNADAWQGVASHGILSRSFPVSGEGILYERVDHG